MAAGGPSLPRSHRFPASLNCMEMLDAWPTQRPNAAEIAPAHSNRRPARPKHLSYTQDSCLGRCAAEDFPGRASKGPEQAQ
jgi:hypothetical protein